MKGKHKNHIEHTNQRKIKLHYINANYKNNNTKHNIKSNSKDPAKYPNTYIKKLIPYTTIRRTNHTQHQLKHIDDLTKPHIIKNKLVRTYLSTFKKFKIKSKLDHTHMYIHKERNNKSSTTHSLNQEHGINTKQHIKIFLKIPSICTKKKLNQTQLKPITPASEWTQNHTNRPLNYRKNKQ